MNLKSKLLDSVDYAEFPGSKGFRLGLKFLVFGYVVQISDSIFKMGVDLGIFRKF